MSEQTPPQPSGEPNSQPSGQSSGSPSAEGQPQAQTATGYPYPYPYSYGQQAYGQQAYGQRPAAPGQAQRTACAGILLAGLFMLLGLLCLLPSLFSAANQNMVSSATGGNLSEVRVGGDASASEKIAMIELSGVIADVQVSGGLLGGAVDLVGRLRGEFAQAAKDDAVKGVLLRIDSPG
ncbi:MAG TPA: hypothetical protein DEA08_09335, partial [Planctomycetes bacterium]|nr:hypothetical protein [Planctomycetota bacterium]